MQSIDMALDGMAGIEEPRPSVFVLDSETGRLSTRGSPSEWPDFPDADDVEAQLERGDSRRRRGSGP